MHNEHTFSLEPSTEACWLTTTSSTACLPWTVRLLTRSVQLSHGYECNHVTDPGNMVLNLFTSRKTSHAFNSSLIALHYCLIGPRTASNYRQD